MNENLTTVRKKKKKEWQKSVPRLGLLGPEPVYGYEGSPHLC